MNSLILNVLLLLFINLGYEAISQDEDGLPSSKPNMVKSSTNFQNVPPELKAKTIKFFNSLLDNKVSNAYDDFLAGTPLGKKVDDVTSLKKQTTRAFELYGVLKGYDPVNFEMIGTSFIRIRYLGLHSRFPMRWIFTYYKSPEQGWIVTNIKFDDLSDFFFEDN